MSALINMPRAAWKRQPQFMAGITRGPYSKNLVRAYSFFNNIQASDAANGYKITDTNGFYRSFGVNLTGRYFSYTSNQADLGGFNAGGLISTQKKYTIQVVGEWPASRGDGFISPYYFDSQTGRLVVGHDSSDVIAVYDGSWRSFSYVPFGKGVQSIVITLFDAGTHNLYVNGVFLESIAAGTGVDIGGTTRFLFRFAEATPAVYAIVGLLFNQINFWDRALSELEARFISENPWQLFAPSPSRFYLIPTDVALALPTLSSPTAINITSGGFQPRVTATY